jgi:hypothetical protein
MYSLCLQTDLQIDSLNVKNVQVLGDFCVLGYNATCLIPYGRLRHNHRCGNLNILQIVALQQCAKHKITVMYGYMTQNDT